MSTGRFVLATQRLELRELTRNDLDFVAALRGDPEVMRFYPKVLNRDESLALIERFQQRYTDDGYGQWLVCLKDGGQPVGLTGPLRQTIQGREFVEVGYMIDRHYWRQGLASEAAAGCQSWVFEHLDVPAVYALIRPENLPSQGVARKLHMECLPGLVPHYDLPHHLFELTRENWQSRAAR